MVDLHADLNATDEVRLEALIVWGLARRAGELVEVRLWPDAQEDYILLVDGVACLRCAEFALVSKAQTPEQSRFQLCDNCGDYMYQHSIVPARGNDSETRGAYAFLVKAYVQGHTRKAQARFETALPRASFRRI